MKVTKKALPFAVVSSLAVAAVVAPAPSFAADDVQYQEGIYIKTLHGEYKYFTLIDFALNLTPAEKFNYILAPQFAFLERVPETNDYRVATAADINNSGGNLEAAKKPLEPGTIESAQYSTDSGDTIEFEEPQEKFTVESIAVIDRDTISVTFQGKEPVAVEVAPLVHGQTEITFLYEGFEYTVTLEQPWLDQVVVDAEAAVLAYEEIALTSAAAVALAEAQEGIARAKVAELTDNELQNELTARIDAKKAIVDAASEEFTDIELAQTKVSKLEDALKEDLSVEDNLIKAEILLEKATEALSEVDTQEVYDVLQPIVVEAQATLTTARALYAVNAATNSVDMLDMLRANAAVLELDLTYFEKLTAVRRLNVSGLVYDTKQLNPFEDKNAVNSAVSDAVSNYALVTINTATEATLQKAIEDFAGAIGLDLTDYNKLEATSQTKVANELHATTDYSLEDLKSTFNDLVKLYEVVDKVNKASEGEIQSVLADNSQVIDIDLTVYQTLTVDSQFLIALQVYDAAPYENIADIKTKFEDFLNIQLGAEYGPELEAVNNSSIVSDMLDALTNSTKLGLILTGSWESFSDYYKEEVAKSVLADKDGATEFVTNIEVQASFDKAVAEQLAIKEVIDAVNDAIALTIEDGTDEEIADARRAALIVTLDSDLIAIDLTPYEAMDEASQNNILDALIDAGPFADGAIAGIKTVFVTAQDGELANVVEIINSAVMEKVEDTDDLMSEALDTYKTTLGLSSLVEWSVYSDFLSTKYKSAVEAALVGQDFVGAEEVRVAFKNAVSYQEALQSLFEAETVVDLKAAIENPAYIAELNLVTDSEDIYAKLDNDYKLAVARWVFDEINNEEDPLQLAGLNDFIDETALYALFFEAINSDDPSQYDVEIDLFDVTGMEDLGDDYRIEVGMALLSQTPYALDTTEAFKASIDKVQAELTEAIALQTALQALNKAENAVAVKDVLAEADYVVALGLNVEAYGQLEEKYQNVVAEAVLDAKPVAAEDEDPIVGYTKATLQLLFDTFESEVELQTAIMAVNEASIDDIEAVLEENAELLGLNIDGFNDLVLEDEISFILTELTNAADFENAEEIVEFFNDLVADALLFQALTTAEEAANLLVVFSEDNEYFQEALERNGFDVDDYNVLLPKYQSKVAAGVFTLVDVTLEDIKDEFNLIVIDETALQAINEVEQAEFKATLEANFAVLGLNGEDYEELTDALDYKNDLAAEVFAQVGEEGFVDKAAVKAAFDKALALQEARKALNDALTVTSVRDALNANSTALGFSTGEGSAYKGLGASLDTHYHNAVAKVIMDEKVELVSEEITGEGEDAVVTPAIYGFTTAQLEDLKAVFNDEVAIQVAVKAVNTATNVTNLQAVLTNPANASLLDLDLDKYGDIESLVAQSDVVDQVFAGKDYVSEFDINDDWVSAAAKIADKFNNAVNEKLILQAINTTSDSAQLWSVLEDETYKVTLAGLEFNIEEFDELRYEYQLVVLDFVLAEKPILNYQSLDDVKGKFNGKIITAAAEYIVGLVNSAETASEIQAILADHENALEGFNLEGYNELREDEYREAVAQWLVEGSYTDGDLDGVMKRFNDKVETVANEFVLIAINGVGVPIELRDVLNIPKYQATLEDNGYDIETYIALGSQFRTRVAEALYSAYDYEYEDIQGTIKTVFNEAVSAQEAKQVGLFAINSANTTSAMRAAIIQHGAALELTGYTNYVEFGVDAQNLVANGLIDIRRTMIEGYISPEALNTLFEQIMDGYVDEDIALLAGANERAQAAIDNALEAQSHYSSLYGDKDAALYTDVTNAINALENLPNTEPETHTAPIIAATEALQAAVEKLVFATEPLKYAIAATFAETAEVGDQLVLQLLNDEVADGEITVSFTDVDGDYLELIDGKVVLSKLNLTDLAVKENITVEFSKDGFTTETITVAVTIEVSELRGQTIDAVTKAAEDSLGADAVNIQGLALTYNGIHDANLKVNFSIEGIFVNLVNNGVIPTSITIGGETIDTSNINTLEDAVAKSAEIQEAIVALAGGGAYEDLTVADVYGETITVEVNGIEFTLSVDIEDSVVASVKAAANALVGEDYYSLDDGTLTFYGPNDANLQESLSIEGVFVSLVNNGLIPTVKVGSDYTFDLAEFNSIAAIIAERENIQNAVLALSGVDVGTPYSELTIADLDGKSITVTVYGNITFTLTVEAFNYDPV